MKIYLELLFYVASFQPIFCMEIIEECKYNHDKRTYFCSGITEKFPDKFYGNFHLKCTDCNIRVFKEDTFTPNNALVSFNVSNSGIEEIRERAFVTLPTLTYLYLQNNRIRHVAADAFFGLRQVYDLNLDHNDLKTLTPGFLNSFEAVGVTLTNNKLIEIPPKIFKGTFGIMALNMSYNKIGILHPDSLEHLDGLENLDLQHNKLCHIPLGFFKHTKVLKELNLNGNSIRSFPPGVFSGLGNLVSLSLAENEFSEFGATALISLSRISDLDLSKNGLPYLDVNGLHSNAPTLRHININDNLWSCSQLTNMVQYLKTVNVDISPKNGGYFDITNINGVACSTEPIYEKVPFEKFLEVVAFLTKKSVMYC